MTSLNHFLTFDALVSISYYKDVSSWRYTQHAIATKIQSRHYYLIVDDSDFSLFTYFTTCPSWKIIRSSSLINTKLRNLIEAKLKTSKQKLNIGWYMQQFLKLEFLRKFAVNSNVLIWDADTYPTRELDFPSGFDAYYSESSEHHKPYWDLNGQLLGERYGVYPGFSFISQFFGINTSVVVDLHDRIVEHHRESCWLHTFVDQILRNVSKHRFSEYELLGAFSFYSNPEKILKMNFIWKRHKLTCSRTPLTILPLLNNSDVHYQGLERRHMPGHNKTKDHIQSIFYYFLSRILTFWSRF